MFELEEQVMRWARILRIEEECKEGSEAVQEEV
jgi:hypothetical protein